MRFFGEYRIGSCGFFVSNINIRVVLGFLYVGIGNIYLNNLFLIMNILIMNYCLFKKREREIGNVVENIVRESCKLNLNLEKELVE